MKKSVFYIIGLTYEMKSKMLARYFVSYLENEKEKKQLNNVNCVFDEFNIYDFCKNIFKKR